jgi:putative endonuclease
VTDRRTTGARGEALAAQYLTRSGYTIVATGWRCALGEIDLIAQQGTEWVFVEVRARRNADPDAALESIGKRKQARLIALANAWLNEHDLTDTAWRIDVVAITYRVGAAPIVEIIENAIGW